MADGGPSAIMTGPPIESAPARSTRGGPPAASGQLQAGLRSGLDDGVMSSATGTEHAVPPLAGVECAPRLMTTTERDLSGRNLDSNDCAFYIGETSLASEIQ